MGNSTEYNQAYWQANKEKYQEENKLRATLWYYENRERALQKRREWYQKNKENHNERGKRYYQENKAAYMERASARIRGLRGTTELNTDIIALRAQPCAYCGTDPAGTVDHVVPLSRGGHHDIWNLVPACRSCNDRKGTKLLSEWER